ncbi:MAG: hypothetical protein M5U28_40335 [Sandaracinaceae bacterium]|nr:hypothetical protein [Sandaracinaceae bacterium]
MGEASIGRAGSGPPPRERTRAAQNGSSGVSGESSAPVPTTSLGAASARMCASSRAPSFGLSGTLTIPPAACAASTMAVVSDGCVHTATRSPGPTPASRSASRCRAEAQASSR